ncbi:MAG: Eco57I restriction-modification methylase domain-containing protein, partial [Leptospiraceae bacterium]|nr:Eco57I restriction-modification methylase domain-containing protein [Leptospiraceae bacterium]
ETKTTARKQTGSFYTPREIVNYMVDESLIAYFKEYLTPCPSGEGLGGVSKLRHLLSHSTEEHFFTVEEAQNLIQAIHKIKILDPACGSGAFPMGILHKLVYVLHKLDPKNEEWKRLQLNQAEKIPDVNIRKHVKKEIEEAFNEKNNYQDYGRKLFLIKNCIYGVDIQPIAIEISKLRFFISLIIDQKANKDKKDNYGIVPLPNLETNFVAANTLVHLEKPEGLLIGDTLKKLENQLSDIRKQHFDARSYKEKKELREKDKEKRKEISEFLLKSQFSKDSASKIAEWNPYNRLKSADWFDPEHMFGISPPPPASGGVTNTSNSPRSRGAGGEGGFDVVIGNPPYVRQESIKEIKPILQKYYTVFNSISDLYTYFYESGFNLLKDKGVLTFITSNKWMRARYGENLRKFFKTKTKLLQIIDFGGQKVFESATVDTNVTIFQRENVGTGLRPVPTNGLRVVTIDSPDYDKFNIPEYVNIEGHLINQNDLEDTSFSLGDFKEQNIKKKIEQGGVKLKDLGIKIYRGLITGFNEAFIINTETKELLCKKDKKNNEIIKPILRGRDIHRYTYEWNNLWLILIPSGWTNINRRNENPEQFFKKSYPEIYNHLKKLGDSGIGKGKGLYERLDQGSYWWELRDCDYYFIFEKSKIVYPDISKNVSYSMVEKNYYFNNTSYIIDSNSKYILGILNSNLLNFYYQKIANSLGSHVYRFFTQYVEQLPIPKAPIDNSDLQKPFITLVDKILAAKQLPSPDWRGDGGEVSKWEAQIDAMVFHLYGLTEEEMLTVLDSFPKMSIVEKTTIHNYYRGIQNKTFKVG